MLPEFPTDSLHKFKVVVGMFLIGCSLWLLNQASEKYINKTIETNSIFLDAISNGEKLRILTKKSEYIIQKYKIADAQNLNTKDDTEKRPELEDNNQKIRETMSTSAINSAVSFFDAEKSYYFSIIFSFYIAISIISFLLGVYFLVAGFQAWSDLQEYLDDEMRKAARKAATGSRLQDRYPLCPRFKVVQHLTRLRRP